MFLSFVHATNVANGMIVVILITPYNRVRPLFDTVNITDIKSFTVSAGSEEQSRNGLHIKGTRRLVGHATATLHTEALWKNRNKKTKQKNFKPRT